MMGPCVCVYYNNFNCMKVFIIDSDTGLLLLVFLYANSENDLPNMSFNHQEYIRTLPY